MEEDNLYNNETVNFNNISIVQIKYVEMEREIMRINEVGDALSISIVNLIYGINKLAGLVGAETIDAGEVRMSIDSRLNEINKFARNQIDSYSNLNYEISSKISDLNYLVSQLFDENKNIVTVTNESGQEEDRIYQDILNEMIESEDIKYKVTSAGFEYYPEMGKYSDLTFENNEEKMKAFDNFIYTKAMEAGLTDKEAKMAIVISRWETGNYSKEVEGSSAYNYILPSNNNISGAKGGVGEWASLDHDRNGFNIYDTIDQSAEHYMDFLKGGYFDQGLDTFTEMQPKYCPIGDASDTHEVNQYWLSGCQDLYYQLFGEWTL